MQVIFYKNTSEKNKLNKTLTNSLIVDGSFKSDVDIQNPIITTNQNLQDYNYCYIESLNRYYFIDKIEINRSNIYTVYLHIDVLETYKQHILLLNVLVINSNANPFYSGYNTSTELRKTTNIINFENNFNEQGCNVLVAINGGSRLGGEI